MNEKEKPDSLELDRLIVRAGKAVNKAEKSKLYQEAAKEALDWAAWHNRESLNLLNLQEVSDGQF
jgi:hypothetical protein